MGDGQARLRDQVRDRIRRKHHSIRTEVAPAFRVAYNKRRFGDMGAAEVAAFLTHLAVARRVLFFLGS
jgi:hypothetical protein